MIHRTLIAPDVHCPNHDEPSVNAFLQFAKFYKPHRFIQLGDFCDWDAVSRYEPKTANQIANIQEEVDASNAMLDRFEAVLPKNCHKVMIGGNHEARYEMFKINHGHKEGIRNLRKFTTWHEEYNLDARDWDHCEYTKWFLFWRVMYTHGVFCGNNAAKKHLDEYGVNLIFGHTHRNLVADKWDNILDKNPISAESIGTLSRLDLHYLPIPKSDWVHGFMYIDTNTKENFKFSKHFVRIIKGKFIEFGRAFGS